MTATKKTKINEQALKVERHIIEMGGRCIRHEVSSDKRFDLDFYIYNGRLVIVQVHKEHGGVEVFRPINQKNDMTALLADTKEYLETGFNDPAPTN